MVDGFDSIGGRDCGAARSAVYAEREDKRHRRRRGEST